MEKKLSKMEWREHVRKAEEHAQGIKGYCREHGLVNSSVHYWKKKWEKKLPQFTPVEIVPAKRNAARLPDVKWLADFLRAVERGGA
jgi:transposase-like protein